MVFLRPRFAVLSATLALSLAILPLTASANDSDGDGIADETESAAARVVVSVPYSEGTWRGVEVRSSSQGASPNDVIGLRYESGRIDAWYFANASHVLPAVGFSLRFRELLEFRGPPGPEISGGDIVKVIALADLLDSVPIWMSDRTTEDGGREATFEIGPATGPFSMTLHVTERFVLIGGDLVSPMEVKVDFHIRNFAIELGTSVAIRWDLQPYSGTESAAHLDNTSHDERAGYAENEQEMNVSAPENHAMFFSWSNNATVDGAIRPVVMTPPVTTFGATEAYIVYPRGSAIDHGSKVGARSEAFAAILGRTIPPVPQGNVVLFLAALAAFSVVVAGTVVWRRGGSRR